MKSVISEFKLVDRGFKDFLVLVPGWATDFRIFTTLDLEYNYLLPVKFNPFNFNDGLINTLKRGSINKISLFGWSLGAFMAQDFAISNPNLVDELTLVGIRNRYERKRLEEIKIKLLKNKKAFLYKFYLECFSKNDKDGLLWFKRNLIKDYCSQMQLNDLIAGLDYLSECKIKTESLSRFKKLKIFHGEDDAITPINEMREIKNDLPLADFFSMPKAGHILFLAKDFKKMFYHG